MNISIMIRQGLLLFSVFGATCAVAMEPYGLQQQVKIQQLAERMIKRREDFLCNKINSCGALLKGNYSLRGNYFYSNDEIESIKEKKKMWINELEGLDSWIEVEGTTKVGVFFAKKLIENGTNGQVFFRIDDDSDDNDTDDEDRHGL